MKRTTLLTVASIACCLLLSSSLPSTRYGVFLEEWGIASSWFSWVVGTIYAGCAVSMLAVWASPGFPRPLTSSSMFLSAAGGGMLIGMDDGNAFASILFGGFVGMLAGGLAAFLIDWDDQESSQLVLTMYSGVVGFVAFVALLGYLHDTFPALGTIIDLIYSLKLIVAGGIGGMAAGYAATQLLPRGADRAFKYSVCVVCAAVSARIAFLAFAHLARG